MTADDREQPLSLRNRLLNWLLTPLFILFLFSLVTGYVIAIQAIGAPYDRALEARAQALAQAYAHAPAELDPAPQDRRPWSVFEADGTRVAGDERLPRPTPLARKRPISFEDVLRGEERMRAVTVEIPGGGGRMLSLGEPLEHRHALVRSILANVVIPQLLIMVAVGVAVWFGVGQGLVPLEKLRAKIERRRAEDLGPLDESEIPDEVRPLVRAVNRLLDRLRGVLEAQRRFVADAAHQLRTPFAGILTQAELARREQDPETLQHGLGQVVGAAQRGAHLVNQLLLLAREEAEPGGVVEPVDLAELARASTGEWVAAALARGHDLGYEGAESGLMVHGRRWALAEILGNLIDNAVRYTPSGGRITVRAMAADGCAELRVEDNGPGIPVQERERVFERFHRVLGSGADGSGLGLAIVRGIVRAHGGGVAIEDAAGGRGVVFVVRLPLLPRAAPA